LKTSVEVAAVNRSLDGDQLGYARTKGTVEPSHWLPPNISDRESGKAEIIAKTKPNTIACDVKAPSVTCEISASSAGISKGCNVGASVTCAYQAGTAHEKVDWTTTIRSDLVDVPVAWGSSWGSVSLGGKRVTGYAFAQSKNEVEQIFFSNIVHGGVAVTKYKAFMDVTLNSVHVAQESSRPNQTHCEKASSTPALDDDPGGDPALMSIHLQCGDYLTRRDVLGFGIEPSY